MHALGLQAAVHLLRLVLWRIRLLLVSTLWISNQVAAMASSCAKPLGG